VPEDDQARALGRTARSVWLAAVTLLASAVMLAAAVIAFAVRARAAGGALLAAMAACGLVSLAAAVRSRNRARVFARIRREEEQARAVDAPGQDVLR
jgi:hypothetical protein